MDFLWSIFNPGGFVSVAMRFLLPFLLGAVFSWASMTFRFRRFRKYRQKIYAAPQKKEPVKRKGLILMISPNQIDTALTALRYHFTTLDYLWLVYSDQSMDNKQKVENFCNTMNIIGRPKLIVSYHVADVNDPLEFHEIINNILTKDLVKYDLSTDDLIADYTGMTAHASVGMVIAALKAGVNLQFVTANYDGRKPVALSPFEIETKYLQTAIGNSAEIP